MKLLTNNNLPIIIQRYPFVPIMRPFAPELICKNRQLRHQFSKIISIYCDENKVNVRLPYSQIPSFYNELPHQFFPLANAILTSIVKCRGSQHMGQGSQHIGRGSQHINLGIDVTLTTFHSYVFKENHYRHKHISQANHNPFIYFPALSETCMTYLNEILTVWYHINYALLQN